MKNEVNEEIFFSQSFVDQRRLFFFSIGISSRCDESHEDFGNLRWGLGFASGTQVSGVWRKRRRRVMVAIVTDAQDTLLSRA